MHPRLPHALHVRREHWLRVALPPQCDQAARTNAACRGQGEAGRIMLKFLALAAVAICATPAAAQESPDRFPSRFVTVVAPFPPGGPSDTTARLLAGPMSKA